MTIRKVKPGCWFHWFTILFLISASVLSAEQIDEEALYTRGTKLIDDFTGNRSALYQARDCFQQILESNPNYAPAYVGLARVVQKLGYINYSNYEEENLIRAHEYLKKAFEIDPELFEAFIYSSYIYYYQKDLVNAKRMAGEAEKRRPSSPSADLLFANIAMKEKNLDEALLRYKRVVENTDDKRILMETYEGLNYAYRLKGEFGPAEEIYLEMIRLDPDSPWAKINYSSFLSNRGRYDEAIEFGERALSEMDFRMGHHVLATAYFNKGGECLWQNGEVEKAGEYFKLAIKHNPSHAASYYGLGSYYRTIVLSAKSKEETVRLLEEAEQAFRMAVTLDPGYDEAKVELEVTIEAKNRIKKK